MVALVATLDFQSKMELASKTSLLQAATSLTLMDHVLFVVKAVTFLRESAS